MLDPELVKFPVNLRKHNPDKTTSDMISNNKASSIRKFALVLCSKTFFDIN